MCFCVQRKKGQAKVSVQHREKGSRGTRSKGPHKPIPGA